MKLTKRLYLLCMFTLCYWGASSSVYAVCLISKNTVDFSLGSESLLITRMVGGSPILQTAKDAQPNPSMQRAIFIGCNNTPLTPSNSYLLLSPDSNLDSSDKRIFSTPQGTREFLAVKNAHYSIQPPGATPPKVYLSFSVYDPDYPDNKVVLTESGREYQLLQKNESILIFGLAIDKVYIYVMTDQNSVPGIYRIDNIKIGEMFTRTFYPLRMSEQSQNAIVRIAPALTFQIKNSTCALEQQNYSVQLDPVVTREFSPTQRSLKLKDLNLRMRCPDEADGVKFNATLTDNAANASENPLGMLKNQISPQEGGSNVQVILLNAQNSPIPISSASSQNVFEFGSLMNRLVDFPIKIGYYAVDLPVTPGNVRAVANINVNYN